MDRNAAGTLANAGAQSRRMSCGVGKVAALISILREKCERIALDVLFDARRPLKSDPMGSVTDDRGPCAFISNLRIFAALLAGAHIEFGDSR